MEQGVDVIEIYGEASQNPLCSITLKDEELFITASECLEETCMMLESLNIFENVNISVMQFKNMSNDRVIPADERIFRGTFLRLHSNKGEKKETICVSVYFPNDGVPISIVISDKNNANVNYVAAKTAELMGRPVGYYTLEPSHSTIVNDGQIFHALKNEVITEEHHKMDKVAHALDKMHSFLTSDFKIRMLMRELEENTPELFANVYFVHPYKQDKIVVRVLVFNGKEATHNVLNRIFKYMRLNLPRAKLSIVNVGSAFDAPVMWIEAGQDYIAKIK